MIDFNYTILIQFFNFLVLLILLNFLLFKPVLRAIQKREQKIGALAEGIEGAKTEADHMGKAYDDSIKEQRRPILENRDSLLAEARGTSVHMIEKARAELSDELSKVKSEIKRESRKVSDNLKTEVDRLSADIAQKILKRSN